MTRLKKNSLQEVLNSKLFAKKSKEYSRLGKIILIARKFINFESEKKDLENMLQDKTSDQEIIDLAQKDLNELMEKKRKI
jgi:peptide chain release factor 1